jgi:hypothetical protein
MTRSPLRLIGFAFAVCLLCSLGSMPQSKRRNTASSGDRLITAFAHSNKLPILFREDEGVFVNTLLDGGGPPPEVERILALGKRAIPLLIRHLDDRRYFWHMEFCCDGSRGVEKVRVSEGVFNILRSIIRSAPPIYNMKCLIREREQDESDDDCVNEKYSAGKSVKRNWLRAYRAGHLRYKKFEY